MKKLILLTAIFLTNLALAQKKEPWQKKYEYSQWDTNEILAATDKNGKTGYITQNGEVAIPFIYEKALPFKTEIGNLGFVKKNSKWGAVDMQGNVKIDFLYDEVIVLRRQIRVRKRDKWGVIDANGKEISQFIYEEPGFFETAPETKH